MTEGGVVLMGLALLRPIHFVCDKSFFVILDMWLFFSCTRYVVKSEDFSFFDSCVEGG